MQLTLYQVDAFTQKIFSGNPAAVCPLNHWLDDEIMQAIALENNLSETAFFVKEKDGYKIRWFTPTIEVSLCGHATLASSFVIFNYLNHPFPRIKFSSLSGELKVTKKDDLISLNFPSNTPKPCKAPKLLFDALKVEPKEVLCCDDYFVVLDSESAVEKIQPDFEILKQLDLQGVIVTAQGQNVDFVSRYFAPNVGIDEDPVTGAIHCALIPFWSQQLNKTELTARQISKRGGELFCKNMGHRVQISGYAVEYLKGQINI